MSDKTLTLKPKREKRERFTPLTVIMLIVLALYCVILLSLLVWALTMSVRHPMDDEVTGFPREFYFGNFSYIYNNFTVDKIIDGHKTQIATSTMLLNSILYALGCSFFQTLVPCITAYLCAKYTYKFSGFVYGAVLVTMVIPIVGNQTSELQMAINLGIYDKIWGMWIMKANFLGLYFLVFHEFFKSLPQAYSEAAEIDGASDFAVMVRIAVPLAKNLFVTVLLINFVTYWNDFQTPMLYLPTHPTISEALYWIKSSSLDLFGTLPVKMAAPMLLLAPVLVLFLCFHKRLLGNLTVGGVNG